MRKTIKLLIALVLLAVMSIGLFGATTNAADKPIEQITLSPVKGYEKLNPGEKFDGSFSITNTGTEVIDLHVYVKPFGIGDNCTENYEVDSEWTQMTSWVNLEKNNYYGIKPDEVIIVRFNIDVPKNAPDGGQYVVIFTEVGKFDQMTGAAIGVTKRLGYKFYADLGGTKNESGTVESLKQGVWYWEPPINSIGEVRNSGNIYFTSTHQYKITSLTGKTVYEESIDQDILPDTCRKVKVEWQQTPTFGVFWVENKINFLGQEQFNEKKLVIVIPIYVVIVFSIMIILLTWALILKIKNRKGMAKGF
ncbi:hypothetical protein FWC31_03545 [Candidatus Saccharibacteria bacterium]|nr:hypothetical protein [Candidatus Saccharibacteria bacterium]